MDRLQRLLIISSVTFLVFFILATGCTRDPVPESFRTDYEYTLHIEANETITNVTFYLPLPVKRGIPMVATTELMPNDFQKENYSAEIVQDAPGIDLTGTYPVQNNEPRYLKITTPAINPDTTQKYVYAIAIKNFTKPDTPRSFVDTVYPITNESVILPKRLSSSPFPAAMTNNTSAQWITYTEIEIPQEIPLYASYTASSSTVVTLSSTLEVMNEWHQEDDSWGYNSYKDYYQWTHTGEFHGSQNASGIYWAAKGSYPNLNHPAWQKVLNRTSPGAS